MRKVSVCASLTYWYEAEIGDDTNVNDVTDLCCEVDQQDPYLYKLTRTLRELGGEAVAETISVIDDKTGDVLY